MLLTGRLALSPSVTQGLKPVLVQQSENGVSFFCFQQNFYKDTTKLGLLRTMLASAKLNYIILGCCQGVVM